MIKFTVVLYTKKNKDDFYTCKSKTFIIISAYWAFSQYWTKRPLYRCLLAFSCTTACPTKAFPIKLDINQFHLVHPFHLVLTVKNNTIIVLKYALPLLISNSLNFRFFINEWRIHEFFLRFHFQPVIESRLRTLKSNLPMAIYRLK